MNLSIQQLIDLYPQLLPVFFLIAFYTGHVMKNKKNRSFLAGMLIGFFLGLIGLLIVYLLPEEKPTEALAGNQNLSKVKTNPTPKPIENEKPALPMITKLWYYLTDQNDTVGPMSFQKLKSDFLETKCIESSYVWNEELTDWKKLTDIPEYLEVLKD